MSDFFEVVMLSAYSEAFLCVGNSFVFCRGVAEKPLFELVHSGVCEHQRRVILDDHVGRWYYRVSFGLEEFKKCFAYFLRCHNLCIYKITCKINDFLENYHYICPIYLVMAKDKRYSLNLKTLAIEEAGVSSMKRVTRGLLLFALSLVTTGIYFFAYLMIFGYETPKEYFLEKKNAGLASELDMANSRLDEYGRRLDILEERDNVVYRSIFGMEEIPSDVREAGYGGVDRYALYGTSGGEGALGSTMRRLDILNKKAYIQSVSFDDVSALTKRAADMASCIPSITPITTDRNIMHLSSMFGYRTDPASKTVKMHTGLDFAARRGTPIYSTGNGTVTKVGFDFYGYGHYVVVDHGFGYKTRYGHMDKIGVVEGQTVIRGEQIGTVGNTGKSFGNHVHYEVIYKGKCVNPLNYLDLDMPADRFASIVDLAESEKDRG